MKSKKTRIILIAVIIYTQVYSLSGQNGNSKSEIEHRLERLKTGPSVLYIAAHPDDENTRLISWLVNDQKVRTAYLSLTRGDGGQNLVGPEQGIELGVIRTQELLAARAMDGAQQFFTRAVDFGYSKTPEETFSKWDREEILSDVVFIIRYFKPDVIITRFATDGSGGHGHHTASALLAETAFDAAADANRFPDQLTHLKPWKTKRLFQNSTARFRNPHADMAGYLRLDVGGYNSLLGKSYGEIAAESRSMHRSQGFGSAKQRGELFEYFKPLKGDTGNLSGILDNLHQPEPLQKKYNQLIAEAIQKWKSGKVNETTNKLIDAKKILNGSYFGDTYLIQSLNKLILDINGIFLEALSEQPLIGLGDSARIRFMAICRSNSIVSLERVQVIQTGVGLKCAGIGQVKETKKTLQQNRMLVDTLPLKTCPEANPGNLHWLSKPVNGQIFQMSQKELQLPSDHSGKMLAFFEMKIGTHDFKFQTPVQYKWIDPDKGEQYRSSVLTPPASINLQQHALLFTDTNSKPVKVQIRSHIDRFQGKLRAAGKSWPIEISRKGEIQELSLSFREAELKNMDPIQFELEIENYPYPIQAGYKELTYDHIPVQPLFPNATLHVSRIQVKRDFQKIGYISGAGDEVANCLSQLGYEVVNVTNEMLIQGNLNSLPAIIIGVRAFNVNENLSINRQKLLNYVEQGGNLIVQYNTNSFAGPFKGKIGPYSFNLTRERVTDENSPVQILLPLHPVLNQPNKITQEDFQGWIQERSLYHGGDPDKRYEMPLALNDAGEKPNSGALLIANFGKGHFIYTGLSFFRQLPAGVPGAYRLLVNLIEMK